MKIKRLIASVVLAAFCLTMISGTASAHSYDVFAGHYFRLIPSTTAGGEPRIIVRDTADFMLRINSSALNDILTYNTINKYATEWNNISSNVYLKTYNPDYYLPTQTSEIGVYGKDLGGVTEEPEPGHMVISFEGGETHYYDMYGKRVHPDNNSVYCEIYMNTWDVGLSIYRKETNGVLAARKTFLHEVGHALLLDHPAIGSQYDDHTYSGRPYAVMNQGFLGKFDFISGSITEHDKSCLITKWGI